LPSTQAFFHVVLDKDFRLGSDRLSIELFDLLGKKLATVVNGVIGVTAIDFSHDCSTLSNGQYFWVVKTTKQGREEAQTIPFVIDR
jgi:hypothetical protein